MRRVTMLSLFVVLCLSVFLGCETTKSLKGKLTSKVSGMTSNVDEDLLAQVPEEKREDVEKAAIALKVSEEKLKLAGLKIQLADFQKKHAGYEEELADELHEEALLALDIAKLEAIDRSDLGEKEDIINKRADLKSKKLEAEAERVKIEAKVATSKRHIDQLTKQIQNQKDTIEYIETGAVLDTRKESYMEETERFPREEEAQPKE